MKTIFAVYLVLALSTLNPLLLLNGSCVKHLTDGWQSMLPSREKFMWPLELFLIWPSLWRLAFRINQLIVMIWSSSSKSLKGLRIWLLPLAQLLFFWMNFLFMVYLSKIDWILKISLSLLSWFEGNEMRLKFGRYWGSLSEEISILKNFKINSNWKTRSFKKVKRNPDHKIKRLLGL